MNTTRSNDAMGDGFLAQVDRILHSDTLRSSEVSRRLFRFLSDKYVSGEADQLKEYTIAVDALEKPASYDPQHDSTVRMQMGRLRQKLAEYYRTEGRDESTIIDLPKGRFKLAVLSRPPVTQTPSLVQSVSQRIGVSSRLFWAGLIFACVLVTSIWSAYHLGKDHNDSQAGWSRDLEVLWGPFWGTDRPLVIALADPPFITFPGGLVCREVTADRWAELENSPSIGMLRKALNSPGTQSRYYTSFGEVGASFLLGRLLSAREPNASFVRTSQLSEAQFAQNNVILVGKSEEFNAQLDGMPLKAEFMVNAKGIQNIHPNPGEPLEFVNQTNEDPDAESWQDGEAYALVSHLAGPRRNTDIFVFTSKNAFGYLGAVQAFTDPVFARTLAAELHRATGEIPRYYQLVLKVRFKEQVPTETTVVLARALR
jgi:hypothetical protein